MNTKKKLPFDFGVFSEMITGGYVYVDKTKQLYKLISTTRYCIFNRPRRFGKSTVATTLNELFLGKKELFKGLWIENSDYTWPVHPVIYLDMSMVVSSSPELLRQSLSKALGRIATSYGTSFDTTANPADQFIDLVTELSKREKVVVLIDEYDYSTVAHLNKPELAAANYAEMRTFYTTLKGLGAHIGFVFLTGVSKMPKDSSYSGLNNVKDISFDPEFAALTGYTNEELHAYFTPYVEDIAAARGVPAQEIFDEMRQWYNGYHFSADTTVSVYNPFSILNYLHRQICQNYWISSGRPSFLVECLKREKYTMEEFKAVFTQSTTLSISGGERQLPLSVLLYQTGYVTIQSANSSKTAYLLDYPNNEVRQAMESSLLAYFTGVDVFQAKTLSEDLRDSFMQRNVECFVGVFQSLLASIPYTLHLESESYYHSIFFIIGKLLGLLVQCEVLTSRGSIDMIVQNKDTVFVIEFKCKRSADEALTQIKERRYYEQFLHSSRKVVLIGVAFKFPEKKLAVSYVSETL